MDDCTKLNVGCRLARLITFVDLPIKKKFRLFSVGVLFWFLVMAALTIGAMATINTSYHRIVQHAVPQERVVQKIIRNMEAIKLDAVQLLESQEVATIDRLAETSQRRLQDVRRFASSLALGGEVADYAYDTGKVLETFETTSLNDDPQGGIYLRELNHLLDQIDPIYAEFLKNKGLVLEKRVKSTQEVESSYERLEALNQQAVEISRDFSGKLSDLYESSSTRISDIIELTLMTIAIVLLVAILLLMIFTRWISQALARPIKEIINQIHSVATGDVDLTNKIQISSRDEIGTLSQEFNNLMDTVHSMTTFKRVIEEDTALEDVYSRLGDVFMREAKIEDFVVYEVKDNQRDMAPVFPYTPAGKDLACNSDILTDCDLCRAKKTGREVSSIAYPRVCKQFKPETGKVHVCVPMIIGGRTGGVTQFLFNAEEGKELDTEAIQRRVYKAETYLKQALSVIEAKRLMNTLKESALKDPLTGLYNRRFLQDHANHIIAGTRRRKKTLGLIMCDLDFFKQVNDQYGHDVGDMVLRETAIVINKSVRDADIVIRFGGEEFFILLTDITDGETVPVAEKIRKAVEENKFKIPNGTIKKTLSLGVSEFPADSEGFWQAIKFADVALYKAKETGRNKTIRFEPEMWSGEQF